MIFNQDNYRLEVIQEECYTVGSSDNTRHYSKEYDLEPEYKASSVYGVTCNEGSANIVILAGGGASVVSDQSAIIYSSKFYLGIGDQLVCLSLPSLEVLWNKKIDGATCFGVFNSPDSRGILIHGELDISKITFTGEIIWTTSGKDIFTEGFTIFENYIEAVDFNNEKYRINVTDGTNTLIKV